MGARLGLEPVEMERTKVLCGHLLHMEDPSVGHIFLKGKRKIAMTDEG